MERAVAFARAHDNKIHRHPGGFWGTEKWGDMQGPWFGTPTVTGLVRRGVATWTKHQDGRGGKFPIELELNGTHRPS